MGTNRSNAILLSSSSSSSVMAYLAEQSQSEQRKELEHCCLLVGNSCCRLSAFKIASCSYLRLSYINARKHAVCQDVLHSMAKACPEAAK
eukprot:19236-Heterococcus_DN1.PRE.1